MLPLQVYILDKDPAVGAWVKNQLHEIGVQAQWVANVSDLLARSEEHPPAVCLVALRPPVSQALALITSLTQEPRFARTVFILMGPTQYKHAAFEAGSDDYITTPPDVIELRKRVRLYLDRAALETRIVTETRISQEMEALGEAGIPRANPQTLAELADKSPVSLLEHAALQTEERNRLAIILHNAGNAVIFIDKSSTVRYMNPATERLLGPNAAHLITWPPQPDNPVFAQEIENAIAKGLDWYGDIRYTLPDGRHMDVSMTLSPAYDAGNDLVGFVIIQRDVGERKALEYLKTRFLADAAFEMRTPVTNIKMRQYLLRQAPPDQCPMHLEALERETERLSALVEAMLELSRLDSGMFESAREETDLNRLVADVVVRYGPAADKSGVTLAFRRNDSLSPLSVDPGQISRAVGILIDNAILYTPEAGHIEVYVGRETWTGGDFLTIQVKDTGMGIMPEAIPHIFERFFRSERVRDSGVRGVGLGLAIAHEIVRLHGGEITVESHMNQGSLFTIWLPTEHLG